MPHNPERSTQGLFFSGGYLYESTGRYGQSGLFRLNPYTGETLASVEFPTFFGEGSTAVGGIIHVLTWRDGLRLSFRETDLAALETRFQSGEGWGLCTDGTDLWKSDGSATLRRYRPVDGGTWEEQERLRVMDQGVPIRELNELEWIDGLIFANVWQHNAIAVIDPTQKAADSDDCPVILWIDCADLYVPEYQSDPNAVLNGIAWDAQKKRLLVTGKLWTQFFEIEFPPHWEQTHLLRDSTGRSSTSNGQEHRAV